MTQQEIGFRLLSRINVMSRRTELIRRRVHKFAVGYQKWSANLPCTWNEGKELGHD